MMAKERKRNSNNSVEQEKKKKQGVDIEPQRAAGEKDTSK